MAQFIPYNQEQAAKLGQDLETTLFGNVSKFIEFYNSGMIAKRSDEVVELVRRVVSTYKNVEEKGGQIIFLSTAEVYLEEINRNLEPWDVIVKIKRELSNAKNENQLSEGDLIVFSKKDQLGYILKVIEKDGQRTTERVGAEKTFNKIKQIKPIYEKVSSVRQEDAQFFYFRASDFLSLDTGFIEKIYTEIPVI